MGIADTFDDRNVIGEGCRASRNQRDDDGGRVNPGKVSVRWPLSLLCLAFMVLAGAPAHAWEIRETLVPEKAYPLRNPAYDILVVTVLAVEPKVATNGNPPLVDLRIDEFLRGSDRGPTIRVKWYEPIFHEDSKEGGGVTESWKERAVSGPPVGAKLIVFAAGKGEYEGIATGSVYRFSPQNRALILEHAATERSAQIQIPVFFLLLALPVVITILFIRGLSGKFAPADLSRVRLTNPALAVLTLGLYIFYETGISSYSNIRIDLIVVLPAVGIAIVVGGLSFFEPMFRSKTSSQTEEASNAQGGLLPILGKSLAWGLATVLAIAVVSLLWSAILGDFGLEMTFMISAVSGPSGFMVGVFLALVIQVRRVLALSTRSKFAYGLILLLLLFPFFRSVLAISEFLK